MKAELLIEKINKLGINIITGVPDSTLKEFCDILNDNNKIEHYVCANEGACIGLAIGTYLSSNNPACVYMQNSGLGNAVNPLTSLAHKNVYAIPMLLVIGWRGDGVTPDEPQHKFMGNITLQLLDILDIQYSVINKETTEDMLADIFENSKKALDNNTQYAIVVQRDTFGKTSTTKYKNQYDLVREDAIKTFLNETSENDVIVSTTGKISRELYEQANILYGHNKHTFLTVGGMGHACSIAQGIAVTSPNKKIYCLDGDGAVLMHMGSLATIANQAPANFIHICLNNLSHESVGCMPTSAPNLKYYKIAEQCGYKHTYQVYNKNELTIAFKNTKNQNGPIFIEVFTNLHSRSNLGRPKQSPIDNKENFMQHHWKF